MCGALSRERLQVHRPSRVTPIRRSLARHRLPLTCPVQSCHSFGNPLSSSAAVQAALRTGQRRSNTIRMVHDARRSERLFPRPEKSLSPRLQHAPASSPQTERRRTHQNKANGSWGDRVGEPNSCKRIIRQRSTRQCTRLPTMKKAPGPCGPGASAHRQRCAQQACVRSSTTSRCSTQHRPRSRRQPQRPTPTRCQGPMPQPILQVSISCKSPD